MYYLGLGLILVLNVLFYIDQVKINKQLYINQKFIFNLVILVFLTVELIFFSIVYMFVKKLFGI